ncbi:hypothetical protein DY000_02051179 [Brassica cretica]|uniref:Uncharacterized protein n=1 Tax=Brassica cretica TaxID=69181 RepID=A0ABQ7EW83_BRACR|nr:hypothetical protein DY000_02051179 [Brassica cretica]
MWKYSLRPSLSGPANSKPDGAFAQSRRGFHVDLGTREKDVGIESDRFLWSDPDQKSEGWSDSDRVEDGYEFFAKRRLVTIFSAPNYGWEFDNAGPFLEDLSRSVVPPKKPSIAEEPATSLSPFSTARASHNTYNYSSLTILLMLKK